MSFLDAYELRACFAPALLVTSPWVLVAIVVIQDAASTLLTSSVAAVVFLALLYAFTFVVRGLGRRIEPRLWLSWGGPPSATVLSPNDPTFTTETKARIRACVAATLRIAGTEQPSWAEDRDRVQDAFRLVRQYIRQRDPKGLWYMHNAEYGFLRNLLGAWWLMLLNSTLAAATCVALWYFRGAKLALVLCTLAVALGALSVLARATYLDEATRTAARRYAESAWTSFLVNAQGSAAPRQGGFA